MREMRGMFRKLRANYRPRCPWCGETMRWRRRSRAWACTNPVCIARKVRML